MIDREVPDQLVEDLYDSLDKGLVYSTSIKINVFQVPKWLEVSIAPRFQRGKDIGYQATLRELSEKDIETTKRVYGKITNGEMNMKQGWPVQNTSLNKVNSSSPKWYSRKR